MLNSDFWKGIEIVCVLIFWEDCLKKCWGSKYHVIKNYAFVFDWKGRKYRKKRGIFTTLTQGYWQTIDIEVIRWFKQIVLPQTMQQKLYNKDSTFFM